MRAAAVVLVAWAAGLAVVWSSSGGDDQTYEVTAEFLNASQLVTGAQVQIAGNPDAAHKAWRQALDILDQLHHPDASQVRARLNPAPDQRPVPGPPGRR